MLKRIPKSDISIRPFKAYKEWSFNNSDSGSITMLEANENSQDLNLIPTGSLTDSTYPKNSIYGQLRAQFYNGQEDNPFLRSGNKTKSYTNAILSKERFLSGSAKVISIPNVYVGEGIKKGSVILKDNLKQLNEISYYDDSFGNIQDNRDSIQLNRVDIQSNLLYFSDLSNYTYSGSLLDNDPETFDIQNNILSMSYNGYGYELNIISIDIETGIVIVEDIPFLPEESQGIKIGNVFYNQGLIVLTRDSVGRLNNDWQLDYKSTQTIYEHEYLLVANEDEFNVSQNPSAIVEVGRITEFITGSDNKIYKTTTNPGAKYIRKKTELPNGEIIDYRYSGSYGASSAGFEHYDISSSVDSTGSFLSPFITTIGLYDDDCQLVAVAKLPQPIKSEPDIPVNFIIRFDT
jgi:hypothetical protein